MRDNSASFFSIDKCEICGNHQLTTVLDLGNNPLCDDLISVQLEKRCITYPLEIVFCDQCITAHQRYQVPKERLFPRSYHYRSKLTNDVLTGMVDFVDSCIRRYGDLSGKRVLDIGCNDGSLLDIFRSKGALTFGIEPTEAALQAEKNGHPIYQEFFDKEVAKKFVEKNGHPDVICFTNVFAHIENLFEVTEAISVLSKNTTVLIIENHYLGSIIESNQFDTFYHEHPRTYSVTSFYFVCRKMNWSLVDVQFPARYGGNIRVFIEVSPQECSTRFENIEKLMLSEVQFFSKLEVLQKNVGCWVLRKRQKLDLIVKKHGRVAAKAFPGRAAILIQLLGLDESVISAVFEQPHSMKIGHFVPGTRIPIVSDDLLFDGDGQPEVLLNLAWHIPEEIRGYLYAHGYRGDVIDVVESADFN